MKEFAEAFAEKYPRCGIIPRHFTKATKREMTWENLTRPNLDAFARYLAKHMSMNGARQYCAKVKAVMNLYKGEVGLPVDFNKTLSLREEKSQAVYLTEEELNKLVEHRPYGGNRKYVWMQFIMGAYTGARHSDFMDFTLENIQGGNLVYVSKKTRIESIVPCKPLVRWIIQESEWGWGDLSADNFNNTLREVCKRAGIDTPVKIYRRGGWEKGPKWQFVSSHTARRTFATNLYLRGLDLYTISKFLGHKSVEMTARNYICTTIRELPDGVKGYFS